MRSVWSGLANDLSAGGLLGATCQKQVAREVVLSEHLHLDTLGYLIANNLVINCVCSVVETYMNVCVDIGPCWSHVHAWGTNRLVREVLRSFLAAAGVLSSSQLRACSWEYGEIL